MATFDFTSWLRQAFPRSQRQSKRAARRKKTQPLMLECLEARVTPSVTVTRTSDHAMFSSIQAAINDPGTGTGTILQVSAGTDSEHVNIDKSVILEGAQYGMDARTRSGAETIVDGGGYTPFYVTASDVTIDGFTIQGATFNNNAFPNLYGIELNQGTSGAHIVNDIIQNNLGGIALANNSSTDEAVIQHDLFRNNTDGTVNSLNTDIYSDQYVAGGVLQNVLIDSNTFTNTSAVENSWALGISNTGATPFTDITFSNNTVTNHGRGVYFYNTTSSMVMCNTITGASHYAVGFFGADTNIQVLNNDLSNNARGLYIEDDGSFSVPEANSTITAHYNNFANDTVFALGIVDNVGGPSHPGYTGTLDATNNWWGSATGPNAPSNPHGMGATIIDPDNQVEFRPWLVSPPGSSYILLLDPSGKDSLNASGSGQVDVTGGGSIVVDSGNSEDALASGSAKVEAAELAVHGTPGTKTTGGGMFDAAITSGAPAAPDPLASLPTPTQPATTFTNEKIGGGTVTLQPGTYMGGITVSGSAVVYLEPGIYYLLGGGLTVSGQAKVLMAPDAASNPNAYTGTGVLIYNASNQSINVSGQASVNLLAPTSGTWMGISIFQNRSSTAPIIVSGGNLTLNGTVYAARAAVNVSGSGVLTLLSNSSGGMGPGCPGGAGSDLIVFDLDTTGSGMVNVGT